MATKLNKKVIIGTVATLVALAGAIFGYRYWKKKKDAKEAAAAPASSSVQTGIPRPSSKPQTIGKPTKGKITVGVASVGGVYGKPQPKPTPSSTPSID